MSFIPLSTLVRIVPFTLIALLGPVFYPPAALATDVLFRIHNVRNSSGTILAAVFRPGEGFPKNRSSASVYSITPKEGTTVYIIRDFNPGVYAFAFLHDEDGDRDLTSDFLGPKEGFSFSNNVNSIVGLPSFKQAAISVHGAETKIDVHMRYPRLWASVPYSRQAPSSPPVSP